MWAGQRSPFSASVSPAWASRVASVLSDSVGPGRPRKGRGSFLYRNEFMGRVHVTPSPGTLESREGAQDLKGSPQAPGCLPKGGGCPPDGRLGSGPWEGTRPLSTVRSHSPGWGLRDGLGSFFRPGRGPLLLNGFPGGDAGPQRGGVASEPRGLLRPLAREQVTSWVRQCPEPGLSQGCLGAVPGPRCPVR